MSHFSLAPLNQENFSLPLRGLFTITTAIVVVVVAAATTIDIILARWLPKLVFPS